MQTVFMLYISYLWHWQNILDSKKTHNNLLINKIHQTIDKNNIQWITFVRICTQTHARTQLMVSVYKRVDKASPATLYAAT
jgi:hypothetical protein